MPAKGPGTRYQEHRVSESAAGQDRVLPTPKKDTRQRLEVKVRREAGCRLSTETEGAGQGRLCHQDGEPCGDPGGQKRDPQRRHRGKEVEKGVRRGCGGQLSALART